MLRWRLGGCRGISEEVEVKSWRSVRAFVALCVAALSMVAFAASASAVVPTPYGYNDAGGFRNVLPPGENGLDNLTQLFAARSPINRTLPPHFDDQQPLYENLLYGAPTLTEAQIPSYYK